MPIQPTYPGVYIEEVPSGVRTITGVATSITAFIGAAPKGPVDVPTVINNFGDYERLFGGLNAASTMSFAVRDFYGNGGSQAIIVRITGAGAVAADLTLPGSGGDLILEAASTGTWGNNLRVRIDHDTRDNSLTDLFNLTVEEAVTSGGETRVVSTETFRNVSSSAADSRFLPNVLAGGSSLIRVRKSGSTWSIGTARPDVTLSSLPASSLPPGPAFVRFNQNGVDGGTPDVNDYLGSDSLKTGLFALDNADLFNLLCIPPPTREGDTSSDVYAAAATYCERKRAVLLVDPPSGWGANRDTAVPNALAGLSAGLGPTGTSARNAAVYFPRVLQSDPLRDQQLDVFVPSGMVAGIIARTDAQRGVWKAPAGLDAALNGVKGLQIKLTDAENGQLNQVGVNCLRQFPVNGRVVWGARTLRGADSLADEYKYLSVRRTALFIEESLFRGTQWVVFEPNDEPLWSQIRLNVGAFMQGLFRQGAFQGTTPRDAYLVKCDKETTTQNDINAGIVNIVVGFAPLKPAEFVIIKIQQLAGQIET
ncbi:MAG TPA: phage tail sheath subtilisin-like domain-containing protein [Vicinamibacterales bacterium]